MEHLTKNLDFEHFFMFLTSVDLARFENLAILQNDLEVDVQLNIGAVNEYNKALA